MAVTSTPVTSQEPKVIRTSRYEPGAIIGALAGLVFGAVFWIFGARYTIDGVILVCNTILEFLTVPTRISMRWEYYLWFAPVPVLFSAIEWTCSPIGKRRIRHWGLIVAWAIAVLLDILSTLLGLSAAKSPDLVVWIASNVFSLSLLSLVLTFGPESLMRSCAALVWRALRSLFNR